MPGDCSYTHHIKWVNATMVSLWIISQIWHLDFEKNGLQSLWTFACKSCRNVVEWCVVFSIFLHAKKLLDGRNVSHCTKVMYTEYVNQVVMYTEYVNQVLFHSDVKLTQPWNCELAFIALDMLLLWLPPPTLPLSQSHSPLYSFCVPTCVCRCFLQ